jgi:preprotein translocase subunit SecG
MSTVLLVIHLMIAATLVGVVLLQKSEGGALGMGGNSGSGGFLTGRGTANLLTRTTAGLAAAFFATSILLSILANHSAQRGSVFDTVPATAPASGTAPAPVNAPKTEPGQGGGILDKLQTPHGPFVPQNQ